MTPEEILNERGIDFTKKGNNLQIRCLNPDHEDTHPSMVVNSQTGMFHCFSCNSKGNLFTTFNKVINKLNASQSKILSIINGIHTELLSIPDDAIMYNTDFRGITKNTFEHFKVFKSESLLSDRVILPIYNFSGKLVAYQGRYEYSKLDPKYKAYPSGKALPIFPPPSYIKSDTICIVEGMFDMFNFYDKGISDVITGFGLLEAKKSNRQALLDKFITYKIKGIVYIFIVYDGDEPGRKAANKLKIILDEVFIVNIIELPDGLDPGIMSQEQVNTIKEIIYEQKRIEDTEEVF